MTAAGRRRLGSAALLGGALAAGAAAPLAAARVELTVQDAGGAPVAEAVVFLEPLFREGLEEEYSARRSRQTLSSDGRASFEAVPPGRWRVEINLRGTRWLPPRADPLRPPPEFTVPPGPETVAVRLELSPAVPVRLLLDLAVDASGFAARFRHRGSGAEVRRPLHGDGRETTVLLPPGIWEVEVIPFQGFLLVAVWVDRQEWMGAEVVLDLAPDEPSPELVFSFAAPVEVEGVVTAASSERPAVRVRATLLEPGSWQAAARARGVPIPSRVEAFLDRHQRYRLHLPAGRWRVEPVGERLLRSDPPSVERRLGAGEVLQADFTVELEPPEEAERALRARLSMPGRPRLGRTDGAVFEEDTVAGGAALVWTGETRTEVLAAHGLPGGRYRVVAGHVESLQAAIAVEHEPHRPPRVLPELVLDPGAGVRLRARDEDGGPLAGARLTIERLDELPKLLLAAPEFVEAKKARTLVSDLGGGGLATGFYSGRHRLAARVGGERGSHGIVELRVAGGAWQRTLEVELEAAALEIEARARPAARIEATVACADGWRLPATAAVRLLAGAAAGAGEPLAAAERQPLAGRWRDELVVGPLDSGVYRLGLRPQGFDRWTWVHGAGDPEAAEPIAIDAADVGARRAVALGEIRVECGPAVDLLPGVASGAPFPPLWDLRMSARSLVAATGEGLRGLELTPRDAHLELRGMPRGEQILEIRLEHPWLLPGPERVWEIPIELERGAYRRLPLEVEELGGALEVRGLDAGAAVRAVREGAASPPVPVREGAAVVPSLAPGSWMLELCAEPGCRTPTPLREVAVARGRTAIVELRP